MKKIGSCSPNCVITQQPFFFGFDVNFWLFHFSHASLDVRLLDPPEHVPDSEVPGDYWWRHFPRREPHAGPESSEEVRLPMVPGTNGS